MIARAEPECCCPFPVDLPTSFEVTIGPVSDCEVCDSVEELAQYVVQIINKAVAEFEAKGGS